MNTHTNTSTMPHRILETAGFLTTLAAAAVACGGAIIAFLRARWDGETIGRSLLLTGIAAFYCGVVYIVVTELYPHWSKLLIAAGSMSLGFSPKVALQRIDALVKAVGMFAKTLIHPKP
jgi:hypothetical protein